MYADCAPLTIAIAGFYKDARDGASTETALQDSDFVIREFQLFELWIELLQTVAKGIIDGVNGTISCALRFNSLALGSNLH